MWAYRSIGVRPVLRRSPPKIEDAGKALLKVDQQLHGKKRADRSLQITKRLKKAANDTSLISTTDIARGTQASNIEAINKKLKETDKELGKQIKTVKRELAVAKGNASRFRTLSFKNNSAVNNRKADESFSLANTKKTELTKLREVRIDGQSREVKNNQLLRTNGITRKILAP